MFRTVTDDEYDVLSTASKDGVGSVEKRLAFGNLVFGAEVHGPRGPAVSRQLRETLAFAIFRRFFYVARSLLFDSQFSTAFDSRLVEFQYLKGDLAILFCWKLISFSPMPRRLPSDVEFLAAMIRFAFNALPRWTRRNHDSNVLERPIHILLPCLTADRSPFLTKYRHEPSLRQDLQKYNESVADQLVQWGTNGVIPLDKAISFGHICSSVDNFLSEPKEEKEKRELDGVLRKFRDNIYKESADTMIDSCDACGKKETETIQLKRCGKCRVARYCSSECQIADWKQGKHKERCFRA